MENHVPEVEQVFVVRAVNAEKWGTAVELEHAIRVALGTGVASRARERAT